MNRLPPNGLPKEDAGKILPEISQSDVQNKTPTESGTIAFHPRQNAADEGTFGL